MTYSRRVILKIVSSEKRFFWTSFALTLMWYLALFPGRLGADYSRAVRMMQIGESTNWWTALYWWFLRLTTFDGKTIALASLLSIAALHYSLVLLMSHLPGNKNVNRTALLVLMMTPIFGAFGVNVSHDVFQTSGIIIFTALTLKIYKSKEDLSAKDIFPILLASFSELTTQFGPAFILLNGLVYLLYKQYKFALLIFAFSGILVPVSSLGITKVPTLGLVFPIMGDLKCIAQHPDAEITNAEWEYLEDLAPKSEWLKPQTCSFIDYSLSEMSSLPLGQIKLDKELLKNYLRITSRQPAIVAVAHMQRASEALPPPFFYGPVNQIPRDPMIPLGEGTNTALQSFPGLLHPSIDEPSVAKKIKILAPLEVVAQGSILIVNQASWFWGWGGLWLWPIVTFVVFKNYRSGVRRKIVVMSNIALLHSLLLIISSPLPRYVMATILIGLLCLFSMILEKYLEKSK